VGSSVASTNPHGPLASSGRNGVCSGGWDTSSIHTMYCIEHGVQCGGHGGWSIIPRLAAVLVYNNRDSPQFPLSCIWSTHCMYTVHYVLSTHIGV